MEGGAIVYLITVFYSSITTCIDEDLYYIVKNIVHWRGSTRIETFVYV